ncbi:NEL-type E3 ubiquitin ligase domain-containing protein [Pseudomonas oryziphila]|uniref:RING-type E3 ubiquitin transferase n=1 Tax=Pseudomonas oryziphila TaxID=2894079 RepID=A0ABM7CTK6_9PSED|nr:NEL-type E3 ubiquitin ligase domain-containing protein [Pseudomonas oryziphila]AZL74815.1 hypothetical protein EI693_17735 [Pseudomonas oryziphila]
MAVTTPTPTPLTPEQLTDGFIAAKLPAWLRTGSAEQVRTLSSRLKAHADSGKALAALERSLMSPQRFAEQAFEPLIGELLPAGPALAKLDWLEVRRRFRVPLGGGLPEDQIHYLRYPALLRLMQGFAAGASFYKGSGLTASAGETLLFEDLDTLVTRVRALEVGKRYQQLLHQAFTREARALLAAHHRTGFALSCELGLMQGWISAEERAALGSLLSSAAHDSSASLVAYAGELQLLGCKIANGLKIQLRNEVGEDSGVVLYLPTDRQCPLRRFDSQLQLQAFLAIELSRADVRQQFYPLVGLDRRAEFVTTLTTRLQDDVPDLEVQGAVTVGDIFVALAQSQVERYEADARVLLVSNEAVDHKAAEQRLERWKSVGWTALGLVGLAVPVVGLVLFGKLVVDLLGEVYTGIEDWSEGHQHEAREHMLHVAQTVLVTGATVAGASAVARSFQGSAFVDALEPVPLSAGGERLWNDDLSVYESDPGPATLGQDGLYADGQKRWLRIGTRYYEVYRPAPTQAWRLRHPDAEGAYEPPLEHNGERGWRLRQERPLEWDDSTDMLNRLWPHEPPFDAVQADRILRTAGMDKDELRGVWVENRPTPVNLRDTLRRFEADARLAKLFVALRLPDSSLEDDQVLAWCKSRDDMQGLDDAAIARELAGRQAELQGALLEHLSTQAAPSQGLAALVRRDFPGLPQAYVEEVAREVDPEVEAQALAEARLPFALGKRARALLELSRANRAVEGLYLRSACSSATAELVIALLGRLPGWPERLNLELHEGSENGATLAILDPQGPSAERIVLFTRNGRFWLYDSAGRPREEDVAEPGGLFEALAALLKESDRRALKFDASDLAEQLRNALIEQLPATRSNVLARLGWRVSTPWFNPGRRLADGRVGYELGGRSSRPSTERLRQRVRMLYPAFDAHEVEGYVQGLQRDNERPFEAIARQERNYNDLDEALRRWTHTDTEPQLRRVRAQFANRLRAIWRFEGEVARGAQRRADGMRLDISGWRIGSLPELPADIDLGHVTELTMVRMGLTAVNGNFLHVFDSLSVLNLNSNRIGAIPPSLARFTGLRSLLLLSNQIRMTDSDQQVLAELDNLQVLDLSFNPIRRLPLRFDRLPELTTLRARGCELLEVPDGIEHCALLRTADLSNNRIRSVSDALAAQPWSFRRRLNLLGNPLDYQAMERLYQVDLQHGFLLDQVDNEEKTPEPGAVMQRWLGLDKDRRNDQARMQLWTRLEALPGSAGLFELLRNLTATPDFVRAPGYMSEQLWPLLESMDQDAQLREEIFLHADEVRGCHDSHVERFSRLMIHELVYKANVLGAQGVGGDGLLLLGRQLFRLEKLDEIAAEDVRQQDAALRADDPQSAGVDALQVILGYRTSLASELNLPNQPRNLRFESLSHIDATRKAKALAEVKAAEASPALAQSISGRDFWRSYLEKRHGAAFSALAETFSRYGSELDDEASALDSQEYRERWDALVGGRTSAEQTLALRLTEEALEREANGSLT